MEVNRPASSRQWKTAAKKRWHILAGANVVRFDRPPDLARAVRVEFKRKWK
jgi:hypothetical protein